MKYLLDTGTINALVNARRGTKSTREKRDRIWRAFVRSGGVGTVAVSVIQKAELTWGVLKAHRPDMLAKFEAFWAPLPCLVFDDESARLWARTRLTLSQQPGERDLITAVLALQHGLTVVSEDSDFQKIPGLSFTDWGRS